MVKDVVCLSMFLATIQGATLANMLPGALGLLLNCLILAALTVVLSVPIATRRIQ